ncbi:MAG: kynureninase [Bacteroidia bacterium]|nr:kynureninase [Bacteroidia bacterium]
METTYHSDLAYARELDQQDPLGGYKASFYQPLAHDGRPAVYLCGHSLGCQPVRTREYLERELADWQALGVEGHFAARSPWMPYHETLTASTARLTGALPEEVIVMNALTVNLHLMMVSFYRPTPDRYKILIEADAFPSDQYAVASQAAFHGYDPDKAIVRIPASAGRHTVATEDLEEILRQQGEDIALVLLGGVNYYTGQVFEMERITRQAQAQGCVVGWDLAHAIGNVPLSLHAWGVDFACWCSYKYLNGGPGAVGGAFIHQRHIGRDDLPRFAGWWGHRADTRFKMEPVFEATPTAEGWQLSNAPVFSMAALRASMEVFDAAGMEALRTKSRHMTGYLAWLINQVATQAGLEIITPADPAARGCQLSLLTGPGGRRIFDALTQHGVICDWREPNVIRMAPVPLYNSYEDVWKVAQILTKI